MFRASDGGLVRQSTCDMMMIEKRIIKKVRSNESRSGSRKSCPNPTVIYCTRNHEQSLPDASVHISGRKYVNLSDFRTFMTWFHEGY